MLTAIPTPLNRLPLSIRWIPSVDGLGHLVIADAKREASYWVREMPCQYAGRDFMLTARGGQSDTSVESVRVFIGHDRSGACTCKGSQYRPTTQCKHQLACRAVWNNGWLDGANPDADVSNTESPF